MNPLTLLGLIQLVEFRQGVIVGAAALVFVLVVRKVGWLLAWGAAAFLALAWAGRLQAPPETPAWALPVTVTAAGAGAWALRSLLRRAPTWSVGGVFALWILGVWGTVPDTERAVVTMGVAAPMLLALWPRFKVPLGWAGAVVAVAALGFVIASDGAARTGAMIGAFGMIGVPVVAAAASLNLPKGQALPPWWLVAAQALHVIVSGRLAAQLADPLATLAMVVVSSLVIGVGLVWSVRTGRPRRPDPQPRDFPILMHPEARARRTPK